jgi:hypothetical protein
MERMEQRVEIVAEQVQLCIEDMPPPAIAEWNAKLGVLSKRKA